MMSTLSPPQGECIRFLIFDFRFSLLDSDSRSKIKSQKSKIESGFTILEILFTVIIVGIALVPIMKLLPEALVLDAQMERETRVAFLAQLKIEEVKSEVIHDFTQDYTESATAFPSPDSDYKYTVSDDQGTGIKEIAVNIWYDKDGDSNIDADEEDIGLNTKIAER
jgi:type II secretory pathway pseudopilin PulG